MPRIMKMPLKVEQNGFRIIKEETLENGMA